MNNTYTIIKINSDGSVDVKFSIDTNNKIQNISNLPIDNVDNLQLALSEYAISYANGKALEFVNAPVTDPAIVALVGKAQTVETVINE